MIFIERYPTEAQTYLIVDLLFQLFWLPLMLMIYLAVYLKTDQDILQGISKLDYLVKLSIFQEYKQKEIGSLISSVNLCDLDTDS